MPGTGAGCGEAWQTMRATVTTGSDSAKRARDMPASVLAAIDFALAKAYPARGEYAGAV